MASRGHALLAIVLLAAVYSVNAQLHSVRRGAKLSAASVASRTQHEQSQLQDHPWVKILNEAKLGDPIPSPAEVEVRQKLQLDYARVMGEQQRAALGVVSSTEQGPSVSSGNDKQTAEPTETSPVPTSLATARPQQSLQSRMVVGSRRSSASADRATLPRMQKHLSAQLGQIQNTLPRIETTDQEGHAQSQDRAMTRPQVRSVQALAPQAKSQTVPTGQVRTRAVPQTKTTPRVITVNEAGKRVLEEEEEEEQQQQQQQQQEDPASNLPPRTCRVTDSPVQGSNALQSYGLAMVQADKLPPLPSAPGSGGYAPTAGPGVSRTAARAGVLVCLVSSGVDTSSPTLANSPIGGCRDEDPLDPGGCPFQWDRDSTGQGTHLASLVAGSAPGSNNGQQGAALGVLPGVQMYSVRVWDRSPSWRGYAGDGAFGSNRMVAYTSCEGHLRGESAQNLRRTNYRMVMLLDVQATSAAPAVKAGGAQIYPSEQEWIDSAARYGDDILWVAPAGDTSAPAYPAALSAPNHRLLSVGAVGCDGKVWPAGGAAGRRIDILAPGVDIIGAAPARGGGATLTVAPLSSTGGGGSAKGEPFTLTVVLQGNAAARPEAEVTLQPCNGGKCAAGDARQACVVPTSRSDASGLVCDVLSRGACSGGLVLVPQGNEPLIGDDIATAVSHCAPWYSDNRQQSVPPRPRPPILTAPPQAGGRLVSMVAARGNSARAWLGVTAAQQAKRTGTSQAAAWVAGAAARLMARYPQCGATEVASVLMESAMTLSSDGKPTGGRGRGGLLQVQDAEDWLSGRPCALAKAPVATPDFQFG